MRAAENTESPDGSHDGIQPLLEIQNLEVAYNEVILALRGLSLEVKPGTVCALLGANGAGKTTTLRAISGVLKSQDGRITDGSVIFDGEDISRQPADAIVRKGLSQVPEGRQVFADLSVEENLRAAAFTERDRKKVQEGFDLVRSYFPKLGALWKQTAGYLSGGEQQMLAVGRALMLQPRLLVLDEPSLGLAPILVEEISKIITRISREEKTTVLLVEQNAQIAIGLSDYCYVLENGRVVLDGPSAEIKDNQDVKEFYLGISEGSRKNYAAVKHYRRRKRWMT